MVVTIASRNLAEAHTRAIRLYRELLKNVSYVKRAYSLDTPEKDMRLRIATEFRK